MYDGRGTFSFGRGTSGRSERNACCVFGVVPGWFRVLHWRLVVLALLAHSAIADDPHIVSDISEIADYFEPLGYVIDGVEALETQYMCVERSDSLLTYRDGLISISLPEMVGGIPSFWGMGAILDHGEWFSQEILYADDSAFPGHNPELYSTLWRYAIQGAIETNVSLSGIVVPAEPIRDPALAALDPFLSQWTIFDQHSELQQQQQFEMGFSPLGVERRWHYWGTNFYNVTNDSLYVTLTNSFLGVGVSADRFRSGSIGAPLYPFSFNGVPAEYDSFSFGGAEISGGVEEIIPGGVPSSQGFYQPYIHLKVYLVNTNDPADRPWSDVFYIWGTADNQQEYGAAWRPGELQEWTFTGLTLPGDSDSLTVSNEIISNNTLKWEVLGNEESYAFSKNGGYGFGNGATPTNGFFH